MNAIDTNIWIYRHDSRDPQKQFIADQLIMSVRPQILLWQIGCEVIAASRKLAVIGFTEDQAWAALADMQRIAALVALPDVRLWTDAQALQTLHSLSFWDALLIAACILSGVQTLYTENIGAPRTINGLSLVNPFLPIP
jgi:predicted nucleic acid-binding protein